MSRNPLWGFDGTLDYWTALERGEVDGPEKRAVSLLHRVCDQERFLLYCQTGQLPIMGNVTKRIYLALKAGGLLEMEDGVPVAWWCFSIGPYAPDIPDTDHVVSVRTIIEGEELAMFRTGDRHPGGYHFTKHDTRRATGLRDPFVEEFLPKGSARPDRMLQTAELLDLYDYVGKDSKEYDGPGRPRVGLADPIPAGLEDLQYAPHRQHFPMLQPAYANNNYGVQYAGAPPGDLRYRPGMFRGDGIGEPQPAPIVPVACRNYHEGTLMLEDLANETAVGLAPANKQNADEELDSLKRAIAQQVGEELNRGGQEDVPRMPEVYMGNDGRFELREGQPLFAPERGPLARRAPMLGPGIGVDMHDGTVLHVDEDREREFNRLHGFRLVDEIERMQQDGYSPDMIEYFVNNILPQAQLGDPHDALINRHAAGIGIAQNDVMQVAF